MDDTEKADEDFVRVPYLVKIFGDDVHKKYILDGQMMQIGRLPTSHIKINSINVSRSHCTLNFVNGTWTIKDNNSQNGTYVNGQILKKNQVLALQIGDVIFLGPPSENPQAFRYDDFLDKREHKHLAGTPILEDKESSKENHTQSSTESNSVIQSAEDTKEEAKSTQEDTNKKNVLASRRKKNSIKVTDKSQPVGRSNKKETKSSKLPSKPNSNENKNSDESVQVEEDSLSLLEIESENICDQELSASQNVGPSAKEKNTVSNEMENGASQNKRHLEDSDSEHLKAKLALLSEKVKQLEESKSELLKEYECVRNKDKMLDDALAEQRRLKEEMQICESRIQNKFKAKILENLEEDLICNICTEVLIKPTVLDCSHTFCEYCITLWKKKKGQCPICRNKIKSQTKIFVLDDYIDKTLQALTPDQREKRKELISLREKKQNKSKTPTPRRKRRSRSVRVTRRRLPSESVIVIEDNINDSVREVDVILPIPTDHAGNAASATSTSSAYSRVPAIFLSDSDNDSAMEIYLVDLEN